jgi:serine/threonine-protein kinase
MLMPRTAATGATTVLNIPEAAAPVADEPKKRNPWTWPLIALVGVLVLVLVGAVVALVSGGGDTPAPTATKSATSTPTKSSTPTSSATPTASTAAIVKADYVGKPVDAATAALQKLNMTVNQIKGVAAKTAAEVGVVYDVNPTGPQVPNGTTINVTYYAALPVTPTPSGSPTVTPLTVAASGNITVTWPGFTQCPADHDLLGYAVAIDGSVVGNATTTTLGLAAPSTSGSHTVTYMVNCSGLALSGASSPTSFTVQ